MTEPDDEIARLMAMSDEEILAEARAEGIDTDKLAHEMAAQFNVIARLVRERDKARELLGRSWIRNARHSREVRALQHEREALMTGLGLDHETPGAHTLSEMRAAGAGALMRIEYLETELDRLRGAAQAFCEERSDVALDRLIAVLEEEATDG